MDMDVTSPTGKASGVSESGMALLSPTKPSLQNPDRRFFLWSLTSLGLTTKILRSENRSEATYRFSTPECEVRMSVQFLQNSSTDGFHFRDRLTNHRSCFSATGEEGHGCLDRFVGAMAIARYAFHSRLHSPAPLNLRERVRTIDNDSRITPPPPFERALAVEREVVSDIQAFGYNPDDPQQAAFSAKPLPVWRLLRQDLYLNGQPTAFLIVHWKHTFDLISLVDVIPGDGTQWMGSRP
jgi:hypothetical protein